MTLRNSIFLLILLGIAACKTDPRPGMDERKILEQMKGPEVSSFEDTLLKSAKKSMEQQDFKRAGQFYKQLVDKNPDKVEYKVGMAEALRRDGQFDAAIKVYDEVAAKNPGNLDIMEGKALAIMAKGDYAEAGKLFEQILAKDSTRWRTLNAAGVLFATRNMYDEAMAYYEHALKASPNNPAVLNNVALTLALDKQYDKAIEALQQATRQVTTESAEKKRLDLNLALIYAISGRLSDAEAIARLHLTGAALYNNLGYYAHVAKNDELAKSYLNMALTKNPTYYGKAWRNLDEISQRGGSSKSMGSTGTKGVTVKKGIPGSSQPKTEPKKEEKPAEKKPEETKPEEPAAPAQ